MPDHFISSGFTPLLISVARTCIGGAFGGVLWETTCSAWLKNVGA
jgi:hypothetical protein